MVSSTIKIIILFVIFSIADATKVSHVEVKTLPDQPVEGCPIQVSCLVTMSENVEITYKWQYNDIDLNNTESYLLTIENAIDADNGAGNKYKCTAKDDAGSKEAESDAVDIVKNDDAKMKPTITSSLPADYQYGEGDSYTLSCGNLDCNSMTYKWTKAGQAVAGQTGRELLITAASTEDAYQCETSVNSVASQKSDELKIKGNKLTILQITGPTKPLKNIQTNFMCKVSTSTAGSGASIVYKWFNPSGTEIVNEVSETLNLTLPAAADGTYKCQALTLGQSLEASINIAGVDVPADPVISRNGATTGTETNLVKASKNVLVCSSESAVDSAEYEWTFQASTDENVTTLSNNNKEYSIDNQSDDGNANTTYEYGCKIKIGSTESTVVKATFTLKDAGLVCSNKTPCTDVVGVKYTGVCVKDICQCYGGQDPEPEGCADFEETTTAATTTATTATATTATTSNHGNHVICDKGIVTLIFATLVILLT